MSKTVQDLRALWALDDSITFLNHGSFGATPREVQAVQTELRSLLEAEPVAFFVRRADDLLAAARADLGRLLGADPERLAFLPNATAGVNTVLRSLAPGLRPGDELLVTDQEYNACRNALDFVAAERGARVVVAPVPFPVTSAEAIVAAVVERVTPRTRLLLVDHVTSPTAVVQPVLDLCRAVAPQGVEVLIDGAHAPGMLPLDLRALEAAGATYYTGNLHKWICAPKGAAFLSVAEHRLADVRPLSISHGANAPLRGRSRFRAEFDWLGTDDPTAWLSVPAAIRFLEGALPGGLLAVMAENRRKALAGRDVLCRALGVAAPTPDALVGSMAAVPLPDGDGGPLAPPYHLDPLQAWLYDEARIEVPIVHWPAAPKRLVRISAQLYNAPEEYVRLAEALLRGLTLR